MTELSWPDQADPAGQLARCLEHSLPGHWAGVEWLEEVDSTNRHLLEAAMGAEDGFHVCVARRQTAGRGRRGRAWVAAPDQSLTFSIARPLPAGRRPHPVLTLVAGLALAQALQGAGFRGMRLKWPNDLVTESGAKLGGMLAEIGRGPPRLVLGVGLNLQGAALLEVDRPVADLASLRPAGDLPDPLALVALLAPALAADWLQLEAEGAAGLLAGFAAWDWLRDLPVRVMETGATGVARGVDPLDGALLLDTAAGRQRMHSGEVSVRLAADA
jgi:BirA family transcriptional regulator, biotin operon repressor / biotin---[acetyl-CoA-carboxylase] ligase